MTKRKRRCVDHEGNTIVPIDRPLAGLRPCPRPWEAADKRKLAQSAYNRSSAKNMKITLAEVPWQKGSKNA